MTFCRLPTIYGQRTSTTLTYKRRTIRKIQSYYGPEWVGVYMKPSTAIALVVLFVGAGIFLLVYKRRPVQRQFKSTDEFVQWLANEAVKDARQQNRVDLDYSVASIEAVEKILSSLHDQYVKNPTSIAVNGLSSAYGAYVGEVIRRTEPGAKWERDDAVGGEKSYPIIWGGGSSYPMAWCYRRIANGPEDNVWTKYRVLKDQRSRRTSLTDKK